jgi:hypothetical protein
MSDRLRVGMLAPVARRVPPLHYGPWERMVSILTEGLVARGVDVTLFDEPFGLSVVEAMVMTKSHAAPTVACHTHGNSDTVRFDAARSGSLMRRTESIAKPAGPAAA